MPTQLIAAAYCCVHVFVTVPFRDGATALHFAAMVDSVAIAEFLLDRGANVNEKTS